MPNPIQRPAIMTAETQAEWQKQVMARIWEIVRELQDYGPGLLDMCNVARAGMTHGLTIQDRIFFKMQHDGLRFTIGYMQAMAPIYNLAINALKEHVVLDAHGNIIDSTEEPTATIEELEQTQAKEGEEDERDSSPPEL